MLQAADTIAEMKVTASKIQIQNTNEKFSKQYLIDAFKLDDNDEQKKAKITSRESFYGIIAQIKILTILLEMTSSLIDDNEFLKATQLFIFSRHISTGLKLDANKEIMKKFPVAMKQWELIAPFFSTIKQKCLQTLENENLTVEETAKCLSSLVVLENCSLEKLLTILVQTRTKTFLKSIENESYDVVKEKLLSSVKILMKTVELIYECFISYHEGDKGLLEIELQKVTDGPTLRLINLKNSAIYQTTLPDIIAKYKPQFKLNPIKKESIVEAINSWLKSVEGIAQNQLKSLIAFVVSIKTIQDIRNMVSTVTKPKNWNLMCKELFDAENFDFYIRFYQPLVNDRIHTIINISWTNILSELRNDVEKLIEENDHVHRDLRHYIWSEDIQDNPKSLKEALSPTKRSHRLLMKASGYSPSIVALCEKIDLNLELLFSELKQYVCGTSDAFELKKIKSNENTNHQKLVQFLRDCSRHNIQSLITTVKSALNSKSAENCVLMARLLESFGELCPNLELCFSGHLLMENSFLRDPTQDTEGDEEWRKVRGLLLEESITFWQMWLATFVEGWKILDADVDEFFMLRDFPCWETVIITEKGENDETVKSEIFVPLGVSISIQNWIFKIISALNRVIPHTLPKSIHSQIVDHLVVRIFEYYEKLTKSEFVNSNQKTAWQFLFDLKVLLLLFVGRENKMMNEKYQQLINHFRGIIDPFDYDVFYKHVSVNIKKCAARLQNIFAILVPNMEYLSGILANQNAQSSHDKDPNILIMSLASSENNWFPLLPIINVKEIPQVPVVEVEKKRVN